MKYWARIDNDSKSHKNLELKRLKSCTVFNMQKKKISWDALLRITTIICGAIY